MNKEVSNSQILQAITELTDQVRDLTGHQQNLSEQVQGLSGQQQNLSEQVQGLSGQHQNLSEQVQGLSGQHQNLSDQVQGLSGQLKQTEKRLAQKIDKLDAKVTVLSEGLLDTQADVKILKNAK